MTVGRISKGVRGGMIVLIRLYQYTFSVFFGPCCRFTPSCSRYAVESIQRFGVAKGIWRSLLRVLRCHPLNPGGYDPVPDSSAIHSGMSGDRLKGGLGQT